MSIGSPVVSSTQGFEYFAISLGDISINLCAVNDTTLETGGSVWHACCSFAKFIIHHKETVQNKSVLELGAGCGLCGILAASLGASFVVLTDLEEQIPHLQSNVDLNKHLFKEGTVVCCPLAFGEDCNLIKKYFNSNSLVDILIGTDIGFDISLHSPLSFTIKSFFNPSVSTPDSIAYVVEELRWLDIYHWFSESVEEALQDYNAQSEEDSGRRQLVMATEDLQHTRSVGDDVDEQYWRLTRLRSKASVQIAVPSRTIRLIKLFSTASGPMSSPTL